MKKWFAVILMCIMMCMFSCAQAVEIQDFEAFSNGLATFKFSDKLNFLRWSNPSCHRAAPLLPALFCLPPLRLSCSAAP